MGYFAGRSRAVLLLWVFCEFFFCLVFAMSLCASVCGCLVVALGGGGGLGAGLLALVCGV